MTEKPAKTSRAVAKAAPAKPAASAKAAKAIAEPRRAAAEPSASRRRSPRRRTPDHDEIAERAYYIHLEEGVGDELANWLRAERELKAA